jgi:hypothetical protein
MKAFVYPAICLSIGLALRDGENKPIYSVRVTPTDFFSGELKRLEHHLDYRSAVCFKFSIQGAVSVWPDVEMWCDGKRVDQRKYGFGGDMRSDEISFMVRQKSEVDNQASEYRVTVGGRYSYARNIVEPKSRQQVNVRFGPVSISQPIELRPGNDSVVAWAMGAGEGFDLSKQEGLDKQIKALPWVMVLRLRIKK